MTDGRISVRDVVVDHVASPAGAGSGRADRRARRRAGRRTDRRTVRALELDHLEIAPASSVAVMGPSGCGKSTLLGLLAGLATPTSGTVTVDGWPLSALPERERVVFRRRRLGMVYQADNLLPYLTVEENVALQAAIAGRTGRAGDTLDRLGLAGYRHRLPDQLSGGQRQRVAIARAVVHHPAVLLADEPTGSLDRDNARRVIELLVEVHRQIGATLVLVTHDPEVARHADRVLELARRRPTARPEAWEGVVGAR